MYEAFYGLHEKPFNLTPDPRFLYLSIKHKEAFAHLFYGIRNRGGFVMVSGEIGTGKTTICRSLLKQLDEGTEVAFIFNPKLSPEELLRTVNADFGIDSTAGTVRGLIDELNVYLLKSSAEDKNCVLVIDEAQNLSTETLEQVRLLSNLETETEKLLQIVLIGQPELADKLALTELRQLNQRITARYHLDTLDRKETLEYIAFRLSVAGGRQRVRFTRAAVKQVHRISGGTPRVINALCDRALLIGYTKEAKQITAGLVKQAAKEVRGDRRTREIKLNFGRVLPASAFVLTSLIALLAMVLITSGPLPFTEGFLATIPRPTAPAGSLERTDPAREAPIVREPDESAEAAIDTASDDSPDSAIDETEPETETSVLASNPLQALSNIAEAASRPLEEEAAPVVEEAPSEVLDEPLEAALEVSDVSTAPEDAAEESADPAGEVETEPAPEAAEFEVATRTEEVAAPVQSLSPIDIVEPEPETVELNPSDLALANVLRAWNRSGTSDLSPVNSVEDIRLAAIRKGLSSVELRITIEQIAIINLPVLARTQWNGQESWVSLLGIEANHGRVVLGSDEEDSLMMHQFRERYTGDVVYLWADSEPSSNVIRVGSGGPEVQLLQERLRSLKLLNGQVSGRYDGQTIDSVMQIQRATGLPVDGIVGPQTRMILSGWLSEFATPSLTTPSFTEAALAGVRNSWSVGEVGVTRGVATPSNNLVPLEPTDDFESPENQSSRNSTPEAAPESVALNAGEPNGSAQVNAETLGEPGYTPQLEARSVPGDSGVTQAAGPIVPIVPSEAPGGE